MKTVRQRPPLKAALAGVALVATFALIVVVVPAMGHSAKRSAKPNAGPANRQSAQTGPPYTIHGTFTLIDYQTADNGCIGTGGFDDIAGGTQVVVQDENGTVIGQGSLEDGIVQQQVTCVYNFTVSGLPQAKFYGITVSHRGEQNYSSDKLMKNGWSVDLTLSSPS